MALSLEQIGEIDQVVGDWCLARVPAHLKQSVDYDYEIDGQAVTILEVRPAWRGTSGEVTRVPVAKFRFVKIFRHWRIYWMRKNLKWNIYMPAAEVNHLVDALDVIESDQYGCFLG